MIEYYFDYRDRVSIFWNLIRFNNSKFEVYSNKHKRWVTYNNITIDRVKEMFGELKPITEREAAIFILTGKSPSNG